MMYQVFRCVRHPARFQIRRGRGQRHLLATRTNRNRNHILFQNAAITNPGVTALCNDIDKIALHDDFNLYGWMAHTIFGNQRRKNVAHDRTGYVQLQPSLNLTTEGLHLVTGRIQSRKQWIDTIHKHFARIGQMQAACRSAQNRNAQLLLNPRDRRTDIRGGHTKPSASSTKATFAHNRDQDSQIIRRNTVLHREQPVQNLPT